jgi:hypothetical protein
MMDGATGGVSTDSAGAEGKYLGRYGFAGSLFWLSLKEGEDGAGGARDKIKPGSWVYLGFCSGFVFVTIIPLGRNAFTSHS